MKKYEIDIRLLPDLFMKDSITLRIDGRVIKCTEGLNGNDLLIMGYFDQDKIILYFGKESENVKDCTATFRVLSEIDNG